MKKKKGKKNQICKKLGNESVVPFIIFFSLNFIKKRPVVKNKYFSSIFLLHFLVSIFFLFFFFFLMSSSNKGPIKFVLCNTSNVLNRFFTFPKIIIIIIIFECQLFDKLKKRKEKKKKLQGNRKGMKLNFLHV
ncbi:hypothetical protein HMI54_014307 [Coelomomyces lativittatus]|nr:hypothetical protein HMI55_004849 [Coelomomyces lativittatus]KAJ1514283.1 hypothetical protein HMI54_014307 [Coelomomyces lativittatus]KAJ1514703.1 hypothetical protein HMI56_007614 [Coelomomyces lativittatus]